MNNSRLTEPQWLWFYFFDRLIITIQAFKPVQTYANLILTALPLVLEALDVQESPVHKELTHLMSNITQNMSSTKMSEKALLTTDPFGPGSPGCPSYPGKPGSP